MSADPEDIELLIDRVNVRHDALQRLLRVVRQQAETSADLQTALREFDAVDQPSRPDFEQLLERPYKPPALFIYEEVELGSGYHTLHSLNGKTEERPWSKPYRKSSSVEYRNRIVRVPYPPVTS